MIHLIMKNIIFINNYLTNNSKNLRMMKKNKKNYQFTTTTSKKKNNNYNKYLENIIRKANLFSKLVTPSNLEIKMLYLCAM